MFALPGLAYGVLVTSRSAYFLLMHLLFTLSSVSCIPQLLSVRHVSSPSLVKIFNLFGSDYLQHISWHRIFISSTCNTFVRSLNIQSFYSNIVYLIFGRLWVILFSCISCICRHGAPYNCLYYCYYWRCDVMAVNRDVNASQIWTL